MKLKPITYRIAMEHSGQVVVDGFAVDAKCGARICVRELPAQFGPSTWTVDHYDTGYRIGTGGHHTAEAAINSAVSTLEAKIASGDYAACIAAIQAKQS